MFIPPLSLLPGAVINAIALGLGGGGAVVTTLGVSSLAEHVDVIASLLASLFGILMVILGFIVRDWKLKQDAMAEEQSRHAGRLVRLEEKERNGSRLLDEFARQFENHTRDERIWQEWAAERLYALAPHLGEKLQLPDWKPLRPRPHDSGEIKKG